MIDNDPETRIRRVANERDQWKTRAEIAEAALSNRPEVGHNVDGRDFYELCQQYRHASDGHSRHPDVPNAAEAFDAIRQYIKTGKLPWASYEHAEPQRQT